MFKKKCPLPGVKFPTNLPTVQVIYDVPQHLDLQRTLCNLLYVLYIHISSYAMMLFVIESTPVKNDPGERNVNTGTHV